MTNHHASRRAANEGMTSNQSRRDEQQLLRRRVSPVAQHSGGAPCFGLRHLDFFRHSCFFRHSDFDIRASFVIRASTFVILATSSTPPAHE
jgi:hypothetical protein